MRQLGIGQLGVVVPCLVFALATVFWTHPDETRGAILAGAFTWALAYGLMWCRRRAARAGVVAGPLASSPFAGVEFPLLTIGLFQLILRNDISTSLLAGLAWALVGAAHLVYVWEDRRLERVPANRSRPAFKPHPFRQDWLLLGVVALLGGIWLMTTRGYGAHGELGISGGIAVMTGVFWALSVAGHLLGEPTSSRAA